MYSRCYQCRFKRYTSHHTAGSRQAAVQRETYALQTNPLEPYFEENPEKRPEGTIISSANWRGYIATFEVEEKRLLVNDIEIEVEKELSRRFGTKWVSVYEEVFGEEKIFVDWFTGLLILPQGELVKYVHLGYASEYEGYILLEIREGILIGERAFTHAEFVQFKEEQFEVFKKTETYKELFDRFKQEGSDDGFIEQFLKDSVSLYISDIQ